MNKRSFINCTHQESHICTDHSNRPAVVIVLRSDDRQQFHTPNAAIPNRSIAPIQKLAVSGDARRQFQMARFHSRGACVKPSNDCEALSAGIKKRPIMDHVESQLVIAASYYSGLFGLPKDPALAAEWYEKAAVQGNPCRAV